MEASKKRHIAKTFTWRITATFTTMIIAWIVSGDPMGIRYINDKLPLQPIKEQHSILLLKLEML